MTFRGGSNPMNLRLFGSSLLVALGCAICAVGQPAKLGQPQSPPPAPKGFTPIPSPIQILPPRPGEEDVEDVRPWLEGKKGKKSDEVDPKVMQKLLKDLNKDGKLDPEQVKQMLKDNPGLLKQLEKMVDSPDFAEKIKNGWPKDQGEPPVGDSEQIKEKLKEVIKSNNDNGNTGDPKTTSKDDPEIPKTSGEEGPKNPAVDHEWVKWMEKNFGDSPAAKESIKDLVSSMEKSSGNGMFDDIPELKNSNWQEFDKSGKQIGGENFKIKPPDFQGGKGASVGGGGGGGSSISGGGGSSGGGSGIDLGNGGGSLAVIAAIVGAVILALFLLRKWKHNQAEKHAQGVDGKPSIDFERIRTREELVRVFDTVSLDKHGQDARSWNHRVIAEQFRTIQPTNAEPAEEVAGLYERARYAPTDEDLSTGEFATARRDLRAIAGVPA
jgi:hypothetical protein